VAVDAQIRATEKEWTGWIGRFEAECRWGGFVRRSLITLRTLTCRESGGIVGQFSPGPDHLGLIKTALFLSGPVIQRAGG
jgi:hypothetical protein